MPRNCSPSGSRPSQAGACSKSQFTKGATSMADDTEQQDLVDVFYRPLVRPLGNLVITFAQAEASLFELVTELDGTEENARRILKNLDDTALERVIELIKASGLAGSGPAGLLEAAVSFWKEKERRNRYIHDAWFP